MRLVTIISAWGDTIELLPHCIENHLSFADGVIVVWSEMSNYGVRDPRMKAFTHPKAIFLQLEPTPRQTPARNERRKRNAGLDEAKRRGFTHFIIADADEFYDAHQVEVEKQKFDSPHLLGLVCGLKVYIRYPTLRTVDHTLVPFIHKLTPEIICKENYAYPFSSDRSGTHIDHTRRFNINKGVQWSTILMHHMSYVRKDISMKINNSTANLRGYRAVIEEELKNACPGYKSKLYNRELEEVENIFTLPIW